jgi:cyclic pyranopterin phosphate synthase
MAEVVPSTEVLRRIHSEMPLIEVPRAHLADTAGRWRYQDGTGEIGLISSVTQAFCSSCSRARLSTEGMLYTCLFATGGHDLRALLRGGKSDAEISNALAHIWRGSSDRYSALRTAHTDNLPDAPGAGAPRVEMSYIGG